MNTYAAMQLHIDRHAYKRGANKGAAPLDASRRSRNHETVRKLANGNMAVRFHQTDVLVVQPDGTFTINCNDWFDSSTTRACINDAFRKFFPFGASVYNASKFSKTQKVVCIKGAEYRYYDGITFDAEGKITSELKPFEAKRIDKSETKAFHNGMVESGFKDMFKLLHATITPEHEGVSTPIRGARGYPSWLRDSLTDKDCADVWPNIVRQFAFGTNYDWTLKGWVDAKLTPQETWAKLMTTAKEDLYETVIAK